AGARAGSGGGTRKTAPVAEAECASHLWIARADGTSPPRTRRKRAAGRPPVADALPERGDELRRPRKPTSHPPESDGRNGGDVHVDGARRRRTGRPRAR